MYIYIQINSSGSVLTPKGVYTTRKGFRVQLNVLINSDTEAPYRRKFSRNCKEFVDALWLYEIAILISDCPQTLINLLQYGNFYSMASMQVYTIYRDNK